MACSTNLRFLGTRNGSNRRLELELRAPQGQQFWFIREVCTKFIEMGFER